MTGLTVEVNGEHRLFAVSSGVTAELHGFTMSTGSYDCRCKPVTGCDLCSPFAIYNLGTLTVVDSTVSHLRRRARELACLAVSSWVPST